MSLLPRLLLRSYARALSRVSVNSKARLQSQLELSEDFVRRDRLNDARQALVSSVASPTISSSEAAKVLKNLLALDLNNSAQAFDIDHIHSIHNKFRPYISKADMFDENVIKFYAQLAKCYFSVGDAESAREVLSMMTATNRSLPSLTMQLWRQLEIEHCECVGLIQAGCLTEASSKLEALLSSATKLLKMCTKGSSEYDLVLESYCDLVKKAATLNLVSKKYHRVSEIVRQALKLIVAAKGENNIDVITMKSHLAISLANQNKSSELIDVCESFLSTEPYLSIQTSSIFSSLSEMLLSYAQAYLQLSLKLSQAAMDILQALSVDSESAAFQYGSHGVILNASGKFSEAKAFFEKAIALLPKAHYRLHLIYHNLGTACIGLGELENATKFLEAAIEGYKQRGNKEFMAACFGHLGEAYEKLGRCEDAEVAICSGVALKREVMPESTQLVVDLQNLAAMKQRKGSKQEAVGLYREALTIVIQHFGESHLQTACARRLLANALIGVRKIDEAIEECEKSLPVLERDGSFAQYEHLVRQYCQLLAICGRHEEAKHLFEKLKTRLQGV